MLKYIFIIVLLSEKWVCSSNQVTCLQEPEPIAAHECVFLSLIEEPADFPGGITAFKKYITDSTFYPEIAYKNKSEGTARIEFTISTKGEVVDIISLNELKDSLMEEAIRVIKASPKWNPAKQHGLAVTYRMVVQITFQWEPIEEEKPILCNDDNSKSISFL